MPEAGRETTADWPRWDDGSIMWDEIEEYERPVGCPLCGAVVADKDAHVRWHEEQS